MKAHPRHIDGGTRGRRQSTPKPETCWRRRKSRRPPPVPLLSPSCPPPHRFGAHSFLWRSVRRLAAHSLQALREIPASMRDGPKKRTKGGSTVRLSSDSLGPLLRGT